MVQNRLTSVRCWLAGGLTCCLTAMSGGAPAVVADCRLAGSLTEPVTQITLHVLLSPRMPYALPEWTRMARVARREGFRVVAYRDARVPLPEWRAAVGAENLPDLLDAPALDLRMAQTCDMLNHAPTAVLTRCGRAHPWPLLGVMPDAAWRQMLQLRRADLEAAPCP